jgi:hypothetical protein
VSPFKKPKNNTSFGTKSIINWSYQHKVKDAHTVTALYWLVEVAACVPHELAELFKKFTAAHISTTLQPKLSASRRAYPTMHEESISYSFITYT